MATTRQSILRQLVPFLALGLTAGGPAGCSSDPGPGTVLVDQVAEDLAADGVGTEDVTKPCNSHEECDPYLCHPELRRCVECVEAGDCQNNYQCVDNRCMKSAGECEGDAQCDAFGKVCDVDAGKCVECLKSKDCPTGEYCKNQGCLAWVCTAGARWCEGQVAKACKDDGSGILWSDECDDEDPCTEGDECVNGQCAEPKEMNCNDDNICTDDSCHPVAGCVHQFNTVPCEDGTQCTTGDTCSGGICTSGPSNCQCNSDSDCVQHDDGDKCNGVLTCGNGTCIPKRNSSVICPVSEDPCQKHVCKPETGLCVEVISADGVECDDLDSCTLEDACLNGTCTGMEQTCNDFNYCTMDACNPTKGCVNTPVTGPCDDGDICTNPDSCQNGVCVGTALTCQDNEPCTKNWCAQGVGCMTEILSGPCEDGSKCTEDDVCVAGVCTGTPVVCNDGNLCTNDLCNPASGCTFTPNSTPCDDNNPCTVNDHCQGGECVPGGTLYSCNDNNPCTNDSCNIDSGECVYLPNNQSCTDDNPCTDGDKCQGGACVPGPQPDCNDNNDCTNDSCDNQGICRNLPISGACNDKNDCTKNDTCIGGNCKGGSPVNCDDNNQCTNDWCEQVGGCKHAFNSNPCNDMNFCTQVDVCTDGVCVGSGLVSCDDNKPCTQDDCSPMTGCSHLYIMGPCQDGDFCTEGDYCAAGACIKGQLISCDDNNDCTNDSCDPTKGCVHSNNSMSCEDGIACTMGDKCDGGSCKGGPVVNCDDGNPCTDDECAFTTCVTIPNQKLCDDGEACTNNDKCSNGYCIGAQLDNCGCHSLHLDGAAGFVRVAHSTLLDLGNTATVELMFKAETQTGARGLMSRWGATDQQAWRIGVTPSSSTVLVEFKVAGSGTVLSLTGTYAATSTNWHHIAFVVDGAVARLYLDGVLKGSQALTAGIANSTAPLRIGARIASGGSLEQYFKGYLDEMRISNAAVYAGNSYTPLPKLAVLPSSRAYYKADQLQYDTLFDATTNYLHGRITPAYYFATDTLATKCAPLDNLPPSSPKVEVLPIAAMADKELTCMMTSLATDAEYDPISYKYEWYLNGVLQPQYTTETVPAEALQPCPRWNCAGCQQWTCKVIPSDTKPGLAGENTQTIGVTKCLTCEGTVHNDHCYLVVGGETDWGSARSACNGWGGFLAVINDAAEQNAVKGLLWDNTWIGLSDTENEGSFKWVNNDPVNYTSWASGQPNDMGTQDCVMMYQDNSYNWNDMRCDNDNTIGSNNAKAYACEKVYPWP